MQGGHLSTKPVILAADKEICMERQTILLQARQAGVKLVRFLYCGNDGLIRGKVAAIEALAGAMEAGIGLTVAMQSFTMLDRLVPEGTFGPVGEIRLVPDLDTFAILPYAPKSARVLVVPPPPIQGIGNAGGFAMQVQLRDGSNDFVKLQNAVTTLVANAQTQSGLQRVSFVM